MPRATHSVPHRLSTLPLIATLLLVWAPASVPVHAAPVAEDGADLDDDAETAGHLACRPSEESKALLDAFEVRFSSDCPEDPECRRERIVAAERLVAEHPDALFLHRNLQSVTRSLPEADQRESALEELRSRYARRAEQHPDDAAAHYLHARLLDGKEDKEARDAALLRSLEADPLFPWAHLERLRYQVLEIPGLRLDEAPESLRVFARQCPELATELLRFQGVITDEDFWRPRLPRLREAVGEEPPELQVEGYPRLWTLEFRLTPPTEHDGLRQQVREDLARLRSHRLTDSWSWWNALKDGYQITGGSDAVARLEEEAGEVAPCHFWTVGIRTRPWMPKIFPDDADPEDVREVWELTERWVEQCPDVPSYSSLRLHAAAKHPDVTDEQLRSAIDRHLESWEAQADDSRGDPPWNLAARLMLDRDLDPERSVELARKAVDAAVAEAAARPKFPNKPERMLLLDRQIALAMVSDVSTLLARAHMVAGDREAAERAIAEAERVLAEIETMEEEQEESVQIAVHSRAAASMYEALAKQSEKLDHAADAFAFYRRAAAFRPENQELAGHAERLWGELGGTDWGRKALAATPVGEGLKVADTVTGWQPRDEPFPDFELADLEGRTWTREDLAGKTVLVNVWATWCFPCREELPLVQKLGERLAGDPDRTVVTLNTDFSIGLVQPFMDEHGYGFPVLLAAEFFRSEFGQGIPQTWIVDPSGTVRLQSTGFNAGQAESWIEDVLGHLDAVNGGE